MSTSQEIKPQTKPKNNNWINTDTLINTGILYKATILSHGYHRCRGRSLSLRRLLSGFLRVQRVCAAPLDTDENEAMALHWELVEDEIERLWNTTHCSSRCSSSLIDSIFFTSKSFLSSHSLASLIDETIRHNYASHLFRLAYYKLSSPQSGRKVKLK